MNLVQAYAYLANPSDKPVNLDLDRQQSNGTGNPESHPRGDKGPADRSEDAADGYRLHPDSASRSRQGQDAKKQLEDLLKKGATGVILDLRASAGGKDSEGYLLANYFVDSGTLGYLQGQKVPEEAFPG